MSTGETTPRAADGTGHPLTLDPRRPLRIHHFGPRLTLAVVSIARLRGAGDGALRQLSDRHLAPQEAAQAATIPLARRRCEWLAGRLAVKQSVCAYQLRHWGSAVRSRSIAVDTVAGGMRAGKPVVDAPVEVGLSHSADLAVAACGPHAVGLDLEHERVVPPLLARLLRVDHEPERADSGPSRLKRMPLPLRWACKEAVLKHYGFGLRIDAGQVRLTGWAPDGRFSWRAGPHLVRHAPASGGGLGESWAMEIDGYFLAVVSA
ncbi:4'-phosphopantetheinyl transferase family protein [Streptomyces sp. AA1529]|uniref:4'-phosphopantetheinyl transferase family protein n=1 Tax=Streptomyces sp. AA1529 TaxID=1203257 RepID=UPI003D749D7B